MERTAFLAGARGGVLEEGFVEWRQVLHHVGYRHLDAMHQRAAVEAVPFKAVARMRARRLDHQPDRAWLRALWGMRHPCWQQEHLAFVNRHIVEAAVIDHLEHHVAL